MRVAIMLTLLTMPTFAQDLKWPANFEKLAARAAEATEVNLDSALLRMAGSFLSGDKPEDAKVKALLTGIRSIKVKSFEFKNEGEYTKADLDALRSQLHAPAWATALSVIEKHESTEIFIKKDDKDRPAGIVILTAEPKELTIVHIDGPVDLSTLSELGGRYGIPNVDLGPAKPKGKD